MKIEMDQVSFAGAGLARPESVLVTRAGRILCSDHQSGVIEVGKPRRTLQGVPPGFVPNGVALLRNGECLIANLGTSGGVWRVDHHARLHPWLSEVGGVPLTVTNFVGLDAAGRIWISMSTRRTPRELSFRANSGDGFVAMVDHDGARIVADGIGFTNECRVDPSGHWLYVNETFDRRLSRFAIDSRALGTKEVVHQFSHGDFPDGLAFDAEGAVWVACVVSNRIVRVQLDGAVETILDDSDPAIIDAAEARYASDCMGRADVDSGSARSLGNVSSIAFGDHDLRTVYLGSLANDRLATFRSPIAGAMPAHWHF